MKILDTLRISLGPYTVYDFARHRIVNGDDVYAVDVLPELRMEIGTELHMTHLKFFVRHNAEWLRKGCCLGKWVDERGNIVLTLVQTFHSEEFAAATADLFERPFYVDLRTMEEVLLGDQQTELDNRDSRERLGIQRAQALS